MITTDNVVRDKLGVLSVDELADGLGVKPETLETWRGQGEGPAYTKLGRAVFYRLCDVWDWIASCVVQVKAGPPAS